MDEGGAHIPGAEPDEPDDLEGSGGEIDDDPLDRPDLPLRGWVPREDRLWLHPSEVGRPEPTPFAGRRPGVAPLRRSPTGAVSAVAVAAVAAAIVATFALAAVGAAGTGARLTASGGPSAATTATTAAVPDDPDTTVPNTTTVQHIARRLRPSLVELVVHGPTTTTTATGVVLHGSAVLTAASALQGATAVTALTATGRELSARLVGLDPYAGVALVELGASLPGATFADERVWEGETVLQACLCSSGGRARPALEALPTTVVTSGQGMRLQGGEQVLDAIAAVAGSPAADGQVLLDSQGRVIGILAGLAGSGGQTTTAGSSGPAGARSAVASSAAPSNPTGSSTASQIPGSNSALSNSALSNSALSNSALSNDTLPVDAAGGGGSSATLAGAGQSAAGPTAVFVPAPVATGVASRLAGQAPPEHGWLGVVATDAPGGECGATVLRVLPGSPAAAAGLRPGDVVDGVGHRSVCSVADLQARLYVSSPGQMAELQLLSRSGTKTVRALLAASPGTPSG
jgi:hypothetical protein